MTCARGSPSGGTAAISGGRRCRFAPRARGRWRTSRSCRSPRAGSRSIPRPTTITASTSPPARASRRIFWPRRCRPSRRTSRPNCLALFLGCKGVEMPGTVWCEPCMKSPEEARFEYNPDNFYWNFALRLGREQLRLGKGKFLVAVPRPHRGPRHPRRDARHRVFAAGPDRAARMGPPVPPPDHRPLLPLLRRPLRPVPRRGRRVATTGPGRRGAWPSFSATSPP